MYSGPMPDGLLSGVNVSLLARQTKILVGLLENEAAGKVCVVSSISLQRMTALRGGKVTATIREIAELYAVLDLNFTELVIELVDSGCARQISAVQALWFKQRTLNGSV